MENKVRFFTINNIIGLDSSIKNIVLKTKGSITNKRIIKSLLTSRHIEYDKMLKPKKTKIGSIT